MTITVNDVGFEKAELHANNGAQLYAGLKSDLIHPSFKVALLRDGLDHHVARGHDRPFHWNFDEKACREAETFFKKLGDELARKTAGR